MNDSFGIGITGGIACGKSAVKGILLSWGWTVLDADEIAHELMEPDRENWKNIVDVFGKEILNRDQTINRGVLGERVFGNPDLREKLNQITHPRIHEVWRSEQKRFQEQSNSKTFAVVIPLLFEKELESSFEKVIGVGCSEKTERLRLASRGLTPSQVELRIKSQMPLSEKIKKSDVVIWNEGTLQSLEAQLRYWSRSISP
ncbi:MAG: dephospho-CoA kinase [Verrucomicrobiota bacterium]